MKSRCTVSTEITTERTWTLDAEEFERLAKADFAKRMGLTKEDGEIRIDFRVSQDCLMDVTFTVTKVDSQWKEN